MFTTQEFVDYAQLEDGVVDAGHLEALKREARVLIRGVVPSLSADGVGWPENAVVVALRVVARGYLRSESGTPYGVNSVSHGAEGFSRSFGFSESATQPGLWLSKQDRKDLRGPGSGGAYSVDLGLNVPAFGGVPDSWTSL